MRTHYIPKPDDIVDAVGSVIGGKRTAVVFSRDLRHRVRATRKQFKGIGTSFQDIVVTIGKPNYQEREFLKLCRRAKTRPKRLWFPGKQG